MKAVEKKIIERFEWKVNIGMGDFFSYCVLGCIRPGVIVQCGPSEFCAVVFDGQMFNRIKDPVSVSSFQKFSMGELENMFGDYLERIEIISPEEFAKQVTEMKRS